MWFTTSGLQRVEFGVAQVNATQSRATANAMKVLILGGSGMLGHKLTQVLGPRFDTWATFRGSANVSSVVFDPRRGVGDVSADNFGSVVNALSAVKPEAVVNCIGIVKQDKAAKDRYQSIAINSLFPHQLARECGSRGVRLIHLSTDCVFNGSRGNYNEDDTADAEDIYGRTKWLGELEYDHCLTIRTSMIGRELKGNHGLLEWFLSQRGKTVRGFKRAIFSGFTTMALGEIIADVIDNHAGLHGVWHVAADPISKFDLLSMVKQVFHLDIEIEPDETFLCDRSLDDSRFRARTGFKPPSWEQMIEQMARDTTSYDEIRRIHAEG
jgi:dTDP-4-dehydrorhamnose reductase